jgi:hypothetical protein
MRQFLLVSASLLAGFTGGILATRMVRSSDRPEAVDIVRARSFQLVDKNGKEISFWGVDRDNNVVLAFGARPEVAAHMGRTHVRDGGPQGLENQRNQLAVIGLQANDSPMLQFNGADRWPRASLYLRDDGKPILLMEDETGPRVSLGLDQSDTPGPDDNDWALVFAENRAWIGTKTEQVGAEKYVRGVFGVSKERVRAPSVARK